ncbi:hypothetical protein ACFS5L_21140 [Streptomyces phyllanthi]|uniref:Uncharacterized protein n=1 Tax=Streptomyces phyllanthi TaxID=1803180 RepID=A0A5N8W4N7_9ACTN|nr:hypothetical protein [Streptomyces phyllanthi]MPY41308.1 hypothetical protein [Streptomyces phyllanthi]
MGSKTVDEAGAETGTKAQSDEETVDVTEDVSYDAEAAEEQASEQPETATETGAPGVGQGAAAIVSVGLALVSLTGSWLGTVAQARDSLYGQLETASGASVSTQIKQVYADSWNANALVAALFALTALIVGVVVLTRPAFGDPDRVRQAPWIKSAAWAGITLGFLGLLLAALKYSNILLAMPTTG